MKENGRYSIDKFVFLDIKNNKTLWDPLNPPNFGKKVITYSDINPLTGR